MSLLNQFGRPIASTHGKRAVVPPGTLTEEQAAPSVIGVRSILSGHPSRGLTPQRLAAILLEAEEGDPTRYFELAEDMEEKDLHYLGVIGTRKRAVAQLELTVEAASDDAKDIAIAEELREFLRRGTLQTELFDILDAVGKGVSCSEIIWEMSGTRWWPAKLKWRDPRWFQFDPEDGETLMLRDGIGRVPLTPYKYIVHVAKAKTGLPIRGGLARAISLVWLFKNFSLKDWVAFGEVFGQPYRVGKYHPAATVDDKSALLRAVSSIGSDAAAIIPESMIIEFIESAKTGSIDVYDRITRFLDEQMSKAVLGQTTTTEVTKGGGSRALGEVHDEVRHDIRDADSAELAATLNRDLVRPYVDLNHGPQAKYPTLVMGRPDELTLPQKLEWTSKFVRQGLRVEASPIRDRLGWSEPDKDSEVLVEPTPGFASGPAVNARRRALARAMHAAGADADAIAGLVESVLDDEGWRPVIDPVISPIAKLLTSATTLEQAREGLAQLARAMDLSELSDRLGDAMFVTRLAGALGIDLENPADV